MPNTARIGRKIVLFLIFAVIITLFLLLDVRIGKLLVKLSESDITDTITISLCNAVNDILEKTEKSPIRLLYSDDGRITGEETDTAFINRLQTDIIKRLYDYVPDAETAVIPLPLGNILGSRLFSGMDVSVPVRILSVTDIDPTLRDEFDSVGINQTRHRIYLHVDIGLKVLVPGYEGETTVSADVPIAETVISGEVPNTIINY